MSGGGKGLPAILQARAWLDDALVALALPFQGRDEAAPSLLRVADALGHVYRALASHTDVATYHAERERAATALREGLAGLQAPSLLPSLLTLPGEPIRSCASSLGLLLSAEAPPFETGYRFPARPSDEAKTAISPALAAEPRLVSFARAPLLPVVPLPSAPPAPTPVVAVPPTPDPAAEGEEPVADLSAIRARLQAALAAAEAPPPEPSKTKEKGAPAEPAVPKATDEEAERETFGEAVPEAVLVAETARGFFEDLGMMSLMRIPDAADPWWELARVEERLLARVDGLLAAGLGTLPPLVRLLADRPVPDPELRWAAVFFYGCLEGDDARDQVARLVRTAELEETPVFDAVADALFLAPQPGIEGLLRGWLTADAPVLKRLAIRVLARRRRLTAVEACRFAASPDLALAREGARALASVSPPVDAAALYQLTAHADEAIVQHVLQAALLHKQAFVVDRARALWAQRGPGFAACALAAALAAGNDAGGLFLQAVSKQPDAPGLLEAAGWFGHLGLIEPLIAALAAGHTDAALALFRLTGAPLTDDDPSPTYDEGELPFTTPFAPPPIVELSVDAAVWQGWWKQHQARAQRQLRYRWGVVWSPALSLWELTEAQASPADRWRAHLELTARTGGDVAFDPFDFVARQRAPLEAWKAHVASRWRASADGSWTNVWGGR